MQSISPAFQSAISLGYQQVIFANINSSGAPVSGFQGLPVLDGSIVIDRNASQRRTFTATINVANSSIYIPTSYTAPLAPFGNEIQLFAGWINPATELPYIVPTTGLLEQVPLGTFAITTSTGSDLGSDLTLVVSGYDRSWSLAQRAFLTPYTVDSGTEAARAIQAIIAAQYGASPSLNWSPASDFDLPLMNFDAGTDPFQAGLGIATSAGYEFFYSVAGVPTGFPIPTPSSSPVWVYADNGTGNAAQSATSRAMTRDGVSNDFWVSATGSQNTPAGTSSLTTPYVAEAADTNPNSPSYIGGDFGDIPTFVTNSAIGSQGQSQSSADNLLAAALGLIDVLTLTVPPAPMFDVDDVIGVVSTRLGVSLNIVLDAVTYSLRYDTKTQITGRTVTA